MPITLRVNGEPRTLDIEPEMPLLWALRDELGLTGTKFGCGIAACGACTVLLDGVPVRTCVLPVAGIEGRRVTTIEGLAATRQAAGAGYDVPVEQGVAQTGGTIGGDPGRQAEQEECRQQRPPGTAGEPDDEGEDGQDTGGHEGTRPAPSSRGRTVVAQAARDGAVALHDTGGDVQD